MSAQIQVRRDTAANWTSTDPTLAQGEMGYETDTGKLKFGDGSTAWTSLDYYLTPDSATDNAVARWDGDEGALQNSDVIIDDDGNVTIQDATGVVGAALTVGGQLVVSDGAGSELAIINANGDIIPVGGRVITAGANWTIRSSAADNSWYSVTYGNGLFVAVANSGTGNRVMTSGYQITNQIEGALV